MTIKYFPVSPKSVYVCVSASEDATASVLGRQPSGSRAFRPSTHPPGAEDQWEQTEKNPQKQLPRYHSIPWYTNTLTSALRSQNTQSALNKTCLKMTWSNPHSVSLSEMFIFHNIFANIRMKQIRVSLCRKPSLSKCRTDVRQWY